MSDPDAPAIVDVLTGFLGAGKTTLVRRLAENGALAGTAVLVNEFADVPVDRRLIGMSGLRAEIFADGCLCCAVDGDLRMSLLRLLESRASGEIPLFSRILIETSGIADPSPLIATLVSDAMLRPRLRLGHVVTLVDFCHAAATIAGQEEAVAQIVAADMVLFTKADMADKRRKDAAIRAVKAINPIAGLMEFAPGGPLLDPFAQVRRGNIERRPVPVERSSHAAGHRHAVAATVLRWPSALDWAVFASWLSLLLHRHGGKVLRMKGALTVLGEEHHGPVVIQSVRHVVHAPEHMASGDFKGGAEIVVIARDLDPALIRRSFETFMRRARTQETRAMPKMLAPIA